MLIKWKVRYCENRIYIIVRKTYDFFAYYCMNKLTRKYMKISLDFDIYLISYIVNQNKRHVFLYMCLYESLESDIPFLNKSICFFRSEFGRNYKKIHIPYFGVRHIKISPRIGWGHSCVFLFKFQIIICICVLNFFYLKQHMQAI